jgi:two-component system, NtrC family, response regulator HydG
VRGAFTGAVEKRMGLFEQANKGTLFLDEIGDLNLPLQAKLLRVVQERVVQRIGENISRKIDVHIISATHRNLRQEVAEGKFREDLFFRLNVIPIHIPPLRLRRDDIMPLAEMFLKKFALLNRSRVKGFSKCAVERLMTSPWPGNVRELENAIERAVVLANSDMIGGADLIVHSNEDVHRPGSEAAIEVLFDQAVSDTVLPLEELERRYIKYVIKRFGGTRDQAAKLLGINRKTLYRRIHEIDECAKLPILEH